ncbi:MAG TPA: peptidylprolyl isomerase, partial [Bacteroidota bacterium]|nr:peptidylprolyl isomerase [Bacteroidota bacterium]
MPRSVPVLTAVAAALAQCAFSQGEVNRHFPVTDPANFTRVVATVGDVRITAQEFLLSYEFGPAFTKRQKDSRRRYLDFMINEKLLALDARDRGLQKSARILKPLEELAGDMATEELFKDDVLSRVKLSGREIAEGMRQGTIHYALRWIFTSGAEAASALESALRHGVPFDTLYARQLIGPVKKDDRARTTTLFGLRRASPLLAAVADTLRQGECSSPVKGPDGWYVVKIDSGWRDVTMSATESEKQEDEARRALTEEKSDSLSDIYVRKMMLSQNPVIVRETFNVLESWLMRIWARPERYARWDIAGRLPGDSSRAVARLEASAQDTLVSLSRGGCIRLGTFLSWYRARTPRKRNKRVL